MGLGKVISRLLMAWVAFLHPCFASYKALSRRPISVEDLERWLKYWSIMGALVGIEYASEWFLSWVPYYWEAKMAFVLYLALPQTQGSTFIYDTYLAPHLTRNETAIDTNIATAQSRVILFLQDELSALWGTLRNLWDHVQVVQESQFPPNSALSGPESVTADPGGTIIVKTRLHRRKSGS